MELPVIFEGRTCIPIQYESRSELVDRLLKEKKLKPPSKCTDRARSYFQGLSDTFLLYKIANGADSEVFIFLEQISGKYGLVKLYDGEFTTTYELERYRDITNRLIEHLAANGDGLGLKISINRKMYKTALKAVPVGEPKANNQVVAVFYDECDWIRGTDFRGAWNMSERAERGDLHAEDVSSGQQEDAMCKIGDFCNDFKQSCHKKVNQAVEQSTGLTDYNIYLPNVKLQIDHIQRILYLVITDIASSLDLLHIE